MLNPNRPVLRWISQRLVPLQYTYPIFPGFGTPPTARQYYVITARSSQQRADKCGFQHIVSVSIYCISKGDDYGYKDSDAMSDEILQLIDSNTQITLEPGFQANALTVPDISNDDGLTDESNVFRTLVTYNLIVTQTL